MATANDPPQPFAEIELPDGTDPIEKGIIRRVRTNNEGTVTVDVTIDGLGDDLAGRIIEQLRGAALTLPEADHVRILPVDDDSGVELPEMDHVIAVASAKGGVGKTTVSVALARTLAAKGLDVGLFDADIYGPNVPTLFPETEGPILTNENGQPVPLETDGIQFLSPGDAGGDPPTARRGAIAYGAVENLLAQGAWEDRDVLLIDMPAGSDDVVGAALEHVPVDGGVFVTTPFDASVEDTRRTLELFEENGISTIAGVVNMTTFECECCGEENDLFEGAVDIDVPEVHELPFDHDLQHGPGSERSHDALEGLGDAVETFLTDVLDDVPEDALDLRELPLESQVSQLSTELARAGSGARVRAVVDDPSFAAAQVRDDAADLLDDVTHRQTGTTGAMLELHRA